MFNFFKKNVKKDDLIVDILEKTPIFIYKRDNKYNIKVRTRKNGKFKAYVYKDKDLNKALEKVKKFIEKFDEQVW